MTLTEFMGPVAAVSGVFMALSPLLQARRVGIARDSSEVSAGVFLMMRVNASIWITYGLASANLVLVVPNAVGLMTTTLTLATIRRHRHTPAATAPAPARVMHAGRLVRARSGAALASFARR